MNATEKVRDWYKRNSTRLYSDTAVFIGMRLQQRPNFGQGDLGYMVARHCSPLTGRFQTLLIEPLYARLYIFSKEVGLGEEVFIGDGSLEVSAWPSHALVGPHTKREFAIIGAAGLISQLSPGAYNAQLLTLVGPGLSKDAGIPFFDLAQDVKAYNGKQESSAHLARRPGTVEISSSVTSFKVTRATQLREGTTSML